MGGQLLLAVDAIDQSVRILSAFERPFSLDLIVRTPAQVARSLKDDDWFLREIMVKVWHVRKFAADSPRQSLAAPIMDRSSPGLPGPGGHCQ